jgi:hypothetical protein
MHRRDFFQRTGVVGIASLPLLAGQNCFGARPDGTPRTVNAADTSQVWHAQDRWMIEDGKSITTT